MANLRLPGPTPVPPDVYEAMSKQMIDHRGVEFAEMLRRTTANLKRAFQTENDLYVLTSSGTGAMEAAVVNTLSPGERVLGVTIGNFGDRFLKIASAYGASVNELKFPDGDVAIPEQIRQALKDDPDVTTVLITHNETSTGITNDLETIAGRREGRVRQDDPRRRHLVARLHQAPRGRVGPSTWWSQARRRAGCARRASP